MPNLADGFLWYLAFLFSTVFHEAAHALLAYKLGDPTAYEGGQVSLNPAPHIRREPFGTVAVPLISFLMGGWMIGWASTPYDPVWAQRYPKRSAFMALAGPSSNLLLAVSAGLLIRLGMAGGVFYPPNSITLSQVTAATQGGAFAAAATLVSIFFTLNILLFLFNLLPFPPLDGSGIVPLFLTERATVKYMDFMHNPAFGLIGLILAWNAFGHIFRPVHLLAIQLLYPGLAYR